jgi:hypothetical protein
MLNVTPSHGGQEEKCRVKEEQAIGAQVKVKRGSLHMIIDRFFWARVDAFAALHAPSANLNFSFNLNF